MLTRSSGVSLRSSGAIVGGGSNTSSSNTPPSFFTSVADCVLQQLLPADGTMKVLLVDEQTLHILSTSVSQTTLLQHGVLLVDRVDNTRPRRAMKALRCVVFVRPQLSSVEAVCSELRRARYQRYTIAFSAAATHDMLERLARADAEGAVAGAAAATTTTGAAAAGASMTTATALSMNDEDDRGRDGLVDRVVEVFCDACAVNDDAFVLEVTPAHSLLSSHMTHSQVRRIAEGLAAMMVSRRCRPHVRYQRRSAFAQRVASELMDVLHGDVELYNYRSHDTVLLLLDRSDDPLTPLLTPWTYEAMLHEHVGLQYNTLHLPPSFTTTATTTTPRSDGDADAAAGYVFSAHDDPFYAANLYSDWGEVCNHVKAYVDKCKEALHVDRATATMDDLRTFVQNMPHTRSLTSTVAKHTTVTSYLSSVIQQRDLLHVALLEQDMTGGGGNPSEHWSRLQALAAQRGVTARDVLRLCLIYHLRHERAAQASSSSSNSSSSSRTAALLDSIDPTYTSYLRKLRAYYGAERSTEALFASTGVVAALVKSFMDTGNMYTQHEPLLKRTLLQLLSGRLDLDAYPYASSPPSHNTTTTATAAGAGAAAAPSPLFAAPLLSASPSSSSSSSSSAFRPREVVVYMCGGYTFAEAALVHAINNNTAYKASETSNFATHTTATAASILGGGGGGGGGGVRVTIGGEATLNTNMFLDLLAQVS